MLGQDVRLADRLRSRDEDAFRSVVARWSPPMITIARCHVAEPAVAQDVVRDAWVAVVAGLDAFDGRTDLRAWAFGVVADLARRRAGASPYRADTVRRPAVDPSRFRGPDDEYAGGWRAECRPADWGARAGADPGQERRAVALALGGLPDPQRAVVELRDVHGIDAGEVCRLLDLDEVDGRILLHHGRSALRSALEEVFG